MMFYNQIVAMVTIASTYLWQGWFGLEDSVSSIDGIIYNNKGGASSSSCVNCYHLLRGTSEVTNTATSCTCYDKDIVNNILL